MHVCERMRKFWLPGGEIVMFELPLMQADTGGAANGTATDIGSAPRQSAKQQSSHAQLVQFQQQQAVQQQMQRLMASDAGGASQLALDVNPDHMNDMLTNHFARNSPDSKVRIACLNSPDSIHLVCLLPSCSKYRNVASCKQGWLAIAAALLAVEYIRDRLNLFDTISSRDLALVKPL